ncbi:MAG TPA: hypothetical protein VMI12_05410 [Puia sp.]|nr:hypothetical protein [Puia sp.]
MKTIKSGLLFCFVLAVTAGLRAQSLDDIINKHITAIGGKDKLNSIKTIYVESTVEVMGNEGASVTYIINGKGVKSETDFNGQKIIQCVTDKGGWGFNPLAGQSSPEALPQDQLRGSQAQFQVGGPLLDYAAKGNKVELQGQEDADSVKKAYKIKLTTKDSALVTYYIDPSTYYIVKAVSTVNANGQSIETAIGFSNYKKTDFGYVMAMEQSISLPQGLTVNITNKKVDINKDIDPKIFDMPK